MLMLCTSSWGDRACITCVKEFFTDGRLRGSSTTPFSRTRDHADGLQEYSMNWMNNYCNYPAAKTIKGVTSELIFNKMKSIKKSVAKEVSRLTDITSFDSFDNRAVILIHWSNLSRKLRGRLNEEVPENMLIILIIPYINLFIWPVQQIQAMRRNSYLT